MLCIGGMLMRSFASLLFCLFGALILPWSVDNAWAGGPHYVFAHYVIYDPVYGASVAGFEHDIQDAEAAGIDGFAIDLGVYNDPTQPYYNANVAYMYSAAQAVDPGFKLFFSVELTNTADIVQLVSTYAGRTNTFRQGTNVVLSTFGLNQVGYQVDWKNGVFAPLSQQGISICFVPFFWPSSGAEMPAYSDATNILATFTNQLSGLFLFGAAGIPSQLVQCNSNYNQAVHQAGKIFMAGLIPSYWGCLQFSDGRRYFEDDGGEGTVAQWESIIANQPDWVEIVTWNDFNESTYLSPVDNPEQYESQFSTPHRNCHAGYYELSKRYISWYKTGVPPATNQEALFYFYRTHSLNLVATNDTPVTSFHGDTADVIYNTLFLTSPAQLKVISGTNSAIYSIGAGLQQVRTPFSPGAQTFTLTRNGTLLLSVQGPPILSSITNYNYFPASGFAYVDNGLLPPTKLVAHP
jgi:glucan endo-1,3-alpha-glucosidase